MKRPTVTSDFDPFKEASQWMTDDRWSADSLETLLRRAMRKERERLQAEVFGRAKRCLLYKTGGRLCDNCSEAAMRALAQPADETQTGT